MFPCSGNRSALDLAQSTERERKQEGKKRDSPSIISSSVKNPNLTLSLYHENHKNHAANCYSYNGEKKREKVLSKSLLDRHSDLTIYAAPSLFFFP